MALMRDGETYDLTPGTPEAVNFHTSGRSGNVLKLIHEYGIERPAGYRVNNGNEKPH